MRYYRACLYCGANLDPGERCDCEKEAAPEVATSESGKGNYTMTKIAQVNKSVNPDPLAQEIARRIAALPVGRRDEIIHNIEHLIAEEETMKGKSKCFL